MVFKRRSRRSARQTLTELVYPRGGWRRAASYVLHRLRRLPDTPDRISRGIAAGVFASFTPLFGLHFILAALVAGAMRGNVLAALLATFFGNPITFPVIVSVSVELGNWMLGQPPGMQLPQIMGAIGGTWAELWSNTVALLTGEPRRWDRTALFFHRVFLPYLVGGLLPGALTGLIAYHVTRPLIVAYQRRRYRKLRARFEKAREDQARLEQTAADAHDDKDMPA